METIPTPTPRDTEKEVQHREELERAREEFLGAAKAIATEYSVPLEHVMKIFAASEGKQFDSLDDKEMVATLFSPDVLRDGVRFELVKTMLELEQSKKEAVLDALTGLFNRGALDIELKRHAEAYERNYKAEEAKPFSFIFVDLDSFKLINDTFGHAIGDVVLKAVSQKIMSHVRPTDFVGRYGGEEIAVIVDGDVGVAKMLAERIREDIASLDVEALGIDPTQRKNVTASFGVSQYTHTGKILDDIKNVLTRADDALYLAKEGGKNKVVVADADASPEAS